MIHSRDLEKEAPLKPYTNALTVRHAHIVPSILANAGENAATNFLEFFAGEIWRLPGSGDLPYVVHSLPAPALIARTDPARTIGIEDDEDGSSHC